MTLRWICLVSLMITALPLASTGGEEPDEFCYVAAIESRPWNGPAGGAAAAVNGAGLQGDQHGARLADTWIQSGAGGTDETWFVLDLQGSCDLQKLLLWNYFEFGGNAEQNATLPNRGVASADIYVATEEGAARIPRNGQGAFNFEKAGWQLIRPGQKFHKAPVASGPGHAFGPTDVVDLTGHTGVTHVALARMKHFAADAFGDYVGLDEVAIVPTPGTYKEDPNHPHAELRAAAAALAASQAMAADPRGRYPKLLDEEGAAGAARLILAVYPTQAAQREIEQLATTLAASPERAVAVLDALEAEGSPQATSAAAELIRAIAGQVGGRPLTDEPAWRPFAEKSTALLTHDDPFVRSLAAWALVAVRDANQDVQADADTPAWLARCLALAPETSVECDFVLQVIASDMHRTTCDLADSAEDVVSRATGLASHARSLATETQRHRIDAAVVSLETTHARLIAHNSPTDLVERRKQWMAVRQAARGVVLACPDMDFQELVYFKVPLRAETVNTDNLVQNHDRPKERPPGGDIFVQSGLAPGDPTRSVIAGQLGPGHVQDMDLWWDADRLVFAYVCQPRWGDGQSAWGHSVYRNGAQRLEYDHLVGFHDGMFWENGSQPTHLYEIRLDGGGLRQLTNDPLYCDREPAYLPGGDVVFSSDRGCAASQCGAAPLAFSDFALPNLFRVSADGGDVQRLTYNKDVDRYPHCLSNGLIGYMRWDYQERFWQWPHSLWTIRPDGTMNDGLFKLHFNNPQSVREPRSIPDSRKLVTLACGHHSPPEGALAVLDPSAGVNNPNGLEYVTPRVTPLEGGLGSSPTVAEGGVPDRGGFYRSPWPLSEKGFLVSYAHHWPEHTTYAVYYIDVWGNKELIHREAKLDVLCPMPLCKRPTPPVWPSNLEPQAEYATCYLDDVNRDMPGIEPGTVRYLRISEKLQWFFEKHDNTGPIRWTPGTQHSRNFGYWSWSPTRVVGTVPVEADGSAYFKVPSGMAVYFQALDENMMEIRRMRSHVEFKPGEFRGCVGCHETKQHVSRTDANSGRMAMRREASQPKPPPWGDVAILGYEELVQPVFDRHCLDCHGATDPDGGLDLTATRDPFGFTQSYRSLFGIAPDMPTPLGEGFREAYDYMADLQPEEGAAFQAVRATIYNDGGLLHLSNHMGGPEVTQPKQFGSHRSRLTLTLLNDDLHREKVSMTDDEWEALVTWLDANAPYHSTYFQYFDSEGNLLPQAVPVRVELDPPFQPGEKTYRIILDQPTPGPEETASD